MQDLINEIRACRICRDEPEGDSLPHEPNPVVQLSNKARILIAGQAPGAKVHKSGKPFTDPSGDRLRDWLDVDKDTFYNPDKFAILPMGFCFPGYDKRGSDMPPRRECANKWRSRIMRGLENVELVLVIGQYAQAWHLGGLRRGTLTETVFDWRQIYAETSPHTLALPHPSWRNNTWLTDNPWFEEKVLPFLRDEVRRLT